MWELWRVCVCVARKSGNSINKHKYVKKQWQGISYYWVEKINNINISFFSKYIHRFNSLQILNFRTIQKCMVIEY